MGCIWFGSQGEMQRIHPHLGLILVFGRSGELEPTYSPEWNIQPRCGMHSYLQFGEITRNASQLSPLPRLTHPQTHPCTAPPLPLDLRLRQPLPHLSLSGAASPSPPCHLSLSLDLWRRRTKGRRWQRGLQGKQGWWSSSGVGATGLASGGGGGTAAAEEQWQRLVVRLRQFRPAARLGVQAAAST